MSEALLRAENVCKRFQTGDGSIEVLKGVNLEVRTGERVAIVGASGVGKSTLLHILGTLDHPTSGRVTFRGEDLFARDRSELARFRNESLGFIFQFHHLLTEFNALENVMMPLLIAGMGDPEARSRAEEGLARVGMAGRMAHRSGQLSGGEQQRCAVARALINDPKVLLADEPSGNLDEKHAGQLHDLLFELARDLETALVIVTHNRALS
ncbi:MAG: ABC transporter ATP-binding protein, partial [Myxococcales bacterium]|nr:ABC transporter ATP-binding protein [Myxococcales bacterium]